MSDCGLTLLENKRLITDKIWFKHFASDNQDYLFRHHGVKSTYLQHVSVCEMPNNELDCSK